MEHKRIEEKLDRHKELLSCSRQYSSIDIHELFLWMAEAAEVNVNVVKEASKYAKDRIDVLRKERPNGRYAKEAVS